MIESICIILLFFTEFVSFVYIGERLKLYENVRQKESASDLTKSEQYAMIRLVFRFFSTTAYILFLIYCLFVAHLFWYSIATFGVMFITGYIIHQLSKQGNSLTKRTWWLRFDAVITMLIWLGPFLEIIKVIF